MKRFIYILALLVCLAVFLVSGWLLLDYFLESKQQQSQFDDLAQLVDSVKATAPAPTQSADQPGQSPQDQPAQTEPLTHTTITDPKTGKDMEILAEYAQLYLLNTDLVGWISIPDTRMNYPVMQTPDRTDHYLHTDFYGKYSAHGCIYAREECDISAPSDNITLYGHNMQDGSMFAVLHEYLEKEFWEAHRFIHFDTLTEHHTYEILAVFDTTASEGLGFAYHLFVDAADEAEFDRFVATCKDLAYYDTGVSASYGDKLITLSTCEYTQTNGRLVVVAKRIS